MAGPVLQKRELSWLRRRLLRWGRANFRPFPWRESRDPYATLLTEVLLKQTNAERVVGVRDALLREYPTPRSLAAAEERAVEAVIAPLGLSRQRAAHLTALGRALAALRAVPKTVAGLRLLPGIGPYAAAAVACFAFGSAQPALDVNVARIVVRVFGVPVVRGEPRRNRRVLELAGRLAAGRRPRELNWALLDLGAKVCWPAPLCPVCPVQERCSYAAGWRPALPGSQPQAGGAGPLDLQQPSHSARPARTGSAMRPSRLPGPRG